MKRKLLSWTTITFVVMIAVLIVAVARPPVLVSEAQGDGTLVYGASVYGTISAEIPLMLYNFGGTAGELVHVEVVGLSNGFDPSVDLLAPDRQILASNQRNSLAVDPHDALIALYLPQTGTYSLMLGGMNGTTGDFLLELNGRSPVSSTPLVFGQRIDVSIAQNAPSQYFSFDAVDCPTSLVVLNPVPGQPFTFPFIVKVRDNRGQDVALLRGGDTLEDHVTVEPLSGTYEVEVWSNDPGLAGTIGLLVNCGEGEPVCPDTGGASVPTGDTGSAPSGEACPECEPCPSELDEDENLCADFRVTVDNVDETGYSISWPHVEGANAAIVSVTGEDGALVYARMVGEVLTDTIDLAFWEAEAGTYAIRVTVGSEELGYHLCEDTITVEYEGSPEMPEPCEIDIVAPREAIANGLQTIFWTSVPGDVENNVEYRVRVYGEFDATVADGRMAAPATSMTLDLSEAAIGVGYGGENDFYLQIDAYWQGSERWCANGVRVTRAP